MRKIDFTDDEIRDIVNDYQNGMGVYDICDKYLSNDFVRIHKSIAVNCRYILAVLKNKVIVDGEKELSVSRGNSKKLERKFLLYRRNNICR